MGNEKNLKGSVSLRMILPGKKKKNNEKGIAYVKNNRILITVNVVGSSGPLRFLVNEDDKVSKVIESSLKFYARGGRLPILGSNFKSFILYASDAGSVALNSSEEIGSYGGRNFMLCKKNNQVPEEARKRMIGRQQSGRWKSCILCIAQ
uniref:uncharacterized protein LOC122590292 n=1 Tax=Erigeron canadensis TaxID=72917 RepID=UPI001CB963B7|nr:uncharacterized protein LOC122590292 [Erigeron canadensis]